MIGATGEQTFVVIPDEGESFEVGIDLRDIRLWERMSPRNTMRTMSENPRADDIFSLVYTAIKRQRLAEVPSLEEWINATRIQAKPESTVAALDRNELAEVIYKAMNYPDTSEVVIADFVMDFLEQLPGRQPDPTRTAR